MADNLDDLSDPVSAHDTDDDYSAGNLRLLPFRSKCTACGFQEETVKNQLT